MHPYAMNRKVHHAGDRRGTSTVEFALVCPLMFMFFFVSLEYGRAHQIKNAVSYAAYQGCRRAIVPGATASQAVSAAQAVLSAGLIQNASISVNPPVLNNVTHSVTVTVSVPLNSNLWSGPWFTQGITVTRACTLTREKTN